MARREGTDQDGREGSAARRSLSSRSSGLALEHPRQVRHPLRRDGRQLPLSASRSRSVSHPQRIINEVFFTSVTDEPSAPVLNPVQALKNCRLGLQSSPNQETHHLNHPPRFRQVPLQEGRGPRPKALKGTSPGAKVHIAEPL